MSSYIRFDGMRSGMKSAVGEVYGRLTVIKDLPPKTPGKPRNVLVKCECGVEKETNLNGMRSGFIVSCGCAKKGRVAHNKTHGLKEHPLYKTRTGMITRCYNSNHTSYQGYGSDGVTVCKEWLDSFEVFYDWAINNGWAEGLEIDKDKLAPTKPGKLYSPDFCCFITQAENAKYRRDSRWFVYNGENIHITDLSERFGLKSQTIIKRIDDYGWSLEKALTTSNQREPKQVIDTNSGRIFESVYKACAFLGISSTTLRYRLLNGIGAVRFSNSCPAQIPQNAADFQQPDNHDDNDNYV